MTWVEAVWCVTFVPYITSVIDSARVQRIEALSGGSLAPQSPDQRPTAQMDKTPTASTLSANWDMSPNKRLEAARLVTSTSRSSGTAPDQYRRGKTELILQRPRLCSGVKDDDPFNLVRGQDSAQ